MVISIWIVFYSGVWCFSMSNMYLIALFVAKSPTNSWVWWCLLFCYLNTWLY